MKLARARRMQEIDGAAVVKTGIPSLVLMENAGRETVSLLLRYFGRMERKKVAVFAGPGNNGGDGFVIARHLLEAGAEMTVYLLVESGKIKGDAAVNLEIVKKLGVSVHLLLDEADAVHLQLDCCDVIVDALFGIGLKREVTGHFAAAVQAINRAGCPVVSVDMPSGIDSDSGRILGVAIRADLTVTYGVAKPGQFVYPGKEMVGALEIVDIGIPARIVGQAGLRYELIDRDMVGSFLPARGLNSHKGTFGHLLVVAGSLGKTGAALLAALGGLRIGTGLVSLCVGRKLNAIYESALFEAMTVPVTGGVDGAPAIADYDEITRAMQGKQAMVIGPGLGMDDGTKELVQRIWQQAAIPLVVDADGLNGLAAAPALLSRGCGGPRILTPHPGEMARLTGVTSKEVQQNRIRAALELAEKANCHVVLKGAGTVIAAPDGRVALNSSGNPGMAAGGMGDVLCGMIGGLLAQGLSPWQACCLSVFVHGLAADKLAEEMGCGYLASEVAGKVPGVMKQLSTPGSAS